MNAHYLLIHSGQTVNTFGNATREILAAEGFNSFQTVDLDAEPLPHFDGQSLIVLTRCYLRQAEIAALLAAVELGAGLVVFQPSDRLSLALGLQPLRQIRRDFYLQLPADSHGGGTPLQTHGILNCHARPPAPDGSILAAAVDRERQPLPEPAVVSLRRGAGRIAVFFYDLPQTIVRLRFGDPALAGYATLGRWFWWSHSADLFVDVLDRRLAHRPQADLQAQFLANLLTELSPLPLPRLWYYERADQCSAAVFSSDDDDSSWEDFDALGRAVEAHGGGITFNLMADTQLTEAQVAELRRRGHTFAPHLNPHRSGEEEWYFAFPAVIAAETADFKRRYGRCSPSLQCHCAPWQGYQDWVPLFQTAGFRMLHAYLSIPVELLNRYLCGSGRPMKFIDDAGTIHDCYQQPAMTFDDATLEELIHADHRPLAADFGRMLQASLDEHYTAMSFSSHPISYTRYSKPLMDDCLRQLAANRVPVYNGDDWCDFQDRRRQIVMERTGDGNWHLSNLAGAVTVLIPVQAGLRSVRTDGGLEARPVRRWKADYLALELPAGRDRATLIIESSAITH